MTLQWEQFDPERFRQDFFEHQNDFGIELAPNMVNIAGHPLGTEDSHRFNVLHVGKEGAPAQGYGPHGGHNSLHFGIPHGETGYRTGVSLNHNLEDNPWGKKGRQFTFWTGMPSQEDIPGWLDAHPNSRPSTDKLSRSFTTYPFEVVHGAFQSPEHLLQAIMERGQSFDKRVQSGQLPSMQSRVAEIEKGMYGPVEGAWYKEPHRNSVADLEKLKRASQSANRVEPEKAAEGNWITYSHGNRDPKTLDPEDTFLAEGFFNPKKDWRYEPHTTLRVKDF